MLDFGISATGSPVSGEVVVRVSPVVLRMRPVSSATRAGDTASRAVRTVVVGVGMETRYRWYDNGSDAFQPRHYGRGGGSLLSSASIHSKRLANQFRSQASSPL